MAEVLIDNGELKAQTDAVTENMVRTLGPLWVETYLCNKPAILACQNKFPRKFWEPNAVLVLGAGPSIDMLDLWKTIKTHHDRADYLIIAVDAAYIPCLKHGIIPDAVISLDISDVVVRMLDAPQHDVTAILSICSDRNLVRNWTSNKIFVLQETMRSVISEEDTKILSGRVPMIYSLGNVGTTAAYIAEVIMRANHVGMAGVDFCCHKIDGKYHAYMKHTVRSDANGESLFEPGVLPHKTEPKEIEINGLTVMSDKNFKLYANIFSRNLSEFTSALKKKSDITLLTPGLLDLLAGHARLNRQNFRDWTRKISSKQRLVNP